MTTETSSLRERVLTNDSDLQHALRMLLDQAIRRQMWLMFIDEQGRLGDPIMPMADYPHDPHERAQIEDLGDVTTSYALMERARTIMEMTGNVSIVLVWERVGGPDVTPADRAWASAMAENARALQVPIRSQLILHDDGVRALYPDDYVS